jgi:hypothetical protein
LTSADWQIQGTDKAPLAGQVICYTATVTGNGSAGIDFNPNYAPAPPAARLINWIPGPSLPPHA